MLRRHEKAQHPGLIESALYLLEFELSLHLLGSDNYLSYIP
jgi:hypothetical protein